MTARYLDAITLASRSVSVTRSFAEMTAEAAPRLHKGAALVAYVDALSALRIDDPGAAKLLASQPNDAALTEWQTVLAQF